MIVSILFVISGSGNLKNTLMYSATGGIFPSVVDEASAPAPEISLFTVALTLLFAVLADFSAVFDFWVMSDKSSDLQLRTTSTLDNAAQQYESIQKIMMNTILRRNMQYEYHATFKRVNIFLRCTKIIFHKAYWTKTTKICRIKKIVLISLRISDFFPIRQF